MKLKNTMGFWINTELIYDHYKSTSDELNVPHIFIIKNGISDNLVEKMRRDGKHIIYEKDLSSKVSILISNHYNSYCHKNYSDCHIRMMYGLHMSQWDLEKWNEMYSLFLAHGNRDAKVFYKKFKKPVYIMGYPKYDKYIDKEKPENGSELNVLWLPTYGEKASSLTAKYYRKLKNTLPSNAKVILRPHPLSIKENALLINEIKKDNSWELDLDASGSLGVRYQWADIILADYNGPVMSSIYLKKNIVLLNTPNAHSDPNVVNSPSLLVRKYIKSWNEEDISEVKTLLSSSKLLNEQKETIKQLKTYFFGEDKSSCSKELARFLEGILMGKLMQLK